MTRGTVIVGGGQAATTAINALRNGGYQEPITLIGDEPVLPYQRPALSKKYLAGGMDSADELLIRTGQAYEKHQVDVRLATRATAIDTAGKAVSLADGTDVPYDHLLLATGARVRRLPIPGDALKGVFYLRTLGDVDAIRAELAPGKRLAIIGGGYIGLEVAAVAVTLGLDVTVVEAADRLMQRVAAEQTSASYHRIHSEEGVRILTNSGVERFSGNGRVDVVHCSNGQEIPADLVIVGVGVMPNCDLAAEAGLSVDDGILVDHFARTSDPAILAAGDCARFPSKLYGRHLRLESVQNSNDQARCAVATLLGKEKAYDPVPWFWSDQYDLKLKIAGLADGADQQIVRGDPRVGRQFAVFHLHQGTLIAVEAVNCPQEYAIGRKLIGERAKPAADLLADASASLNQLL